MSEQVRESTSAKANQPRRRRQLPLLILLVLVAVIAAYVSPVLRLQRVEVTGLQHLTQNQVLDAAGIAIGTPRWAYTAGQVETRLKADPWVQSAKVSWNWDSMQIKLSERQPVGLLPYRDRWLTLDETGLILELVDSPAAEKLPVIGGISAGKALRGQQLTNPGLTDALLVLAWMGDALRSQVGQIQVDADRSLTVFMSARTTVLWGVVPQTHDRVDSVRSKMETLGGFLKEIPKQRGAACQIDLRPEPFPRFSCQ